MHQSKLIGEDTDSELRQSKQKGLLRFITCGSVDDGKSTLIGRLLHDAHLIYEDQLAAVLEDSKKFGSEDNDMNLALLMDGLKSEREQGITIDVAHRYFSTDRRKFIIADTPGHEEYTRNMVTGASNAQLAIILIDAGKGVKPQAKRHTYLVSLLGIKHLIVTVNKMDSVAYRQADFKAIEEAYRAFAAPLGFESIWFVPISALKGDNVVHPSPRMTWYAGDTLMRLLETIEIDADDALESLRFPVQYVNRPNSDFRGYCGTVAAGILRAGDQVMALPSRRVSSIRSIVTYDGDLSEAQAGMAVTVTLNDEIDVSRGDMLVHPDSAPNVSKSFDATLVWMAREPLLPGKLYTIKLGVKQTTGAIERVHHRVDIHTLSPTPAERLELNEIGLCRFVLTEAVAFDPYDQSPATGSFIVIDRVTNDTLGAGMILENAPQGIEDKSLNVVWHEHKISKAQRASQKRQKPCVLWFTGLSGSGKSTISNALEFRLFQLGHHSYLLDGDNIRHGLSKDLGFSDDDRTENIRRIGEACKLFVDAGLIVLSAFISPFRKDRALVRELVEADGFIEIFVSAPLEVCEARDPKGHYAKAREGKIKEFTGISSPYEPPTHPAIILYTERESVEECVEKIIQHLLTIGVLPQG